MRQSDLLYENSKKYRELMDKIHDSIAEEDHYEKEKNPVDAAKVGLQTWVYLKKLMKVLKAENVCDIEDETMYDLLYWATAFANNLHNATIKDKSFSQKKYDFCKEYTEMHEDFLDKDMRNLGNIRREYAECYAQVCDFETFDSLYTKWLQNEPDWGWGWIGWSDSYWLFTGKNEKNFEKALSILEQGLSVKRVNDKKHMMDRLNDLKKEMLSQSCLNSNELNEISS